MSKNTAKIKSFMETKEQNQIFKDSEIDIYEMKKIEQKNRKRRRVIVPFSNKIEEFTL